ncbi:MAG: DUF5615 family PIN-like protein [Phycisphaerae bacterium]
MKVLLDTCVWGGATEVLREADHDVIWIGDWPEDPGDEDLLKQAHDDGRVLITLDKDFGELAVVRGMPHAGIVRLVKVAARMQGPTVVEVLGRYGNRLQHGGIVTVEPGRVRVRFVEP